MQPTPTNMVFVNVTQDIAVPLSTHLAREGVVITGTTRQRWVTHLDVTAADVNAAIAAVDSFFAA